MNPAGSSLKKYWKTIVCAGLFCFAFFLSTYRLTESPPTWMDEGMIIQTSKNLVEEGIYGIRVSPADHISPGFISTSYPVTLPVAASFELFGIGLLQARAVMVVFIMAFLLAAYMLGRRLFQNEWLTLGALALLVSFPPLYGNGKNVLGEVPGLFFLTIFLIFVDRIGKGDRRISQYIFAGLMLGLCVATKPIFILLLPAVVFAFFYTTLKKPEILGDGPVHNSIVAGIFTLIPIILWVYIQFSGDSFSAIFSYYANPHNLNIASSLLSNIKSFLTSPQSLYFLALWLVWLIPIVIRMRRHDPHSNISAAEWIAFGFSTLVFVAYFRNPSYYRYFFLAEIYSLIFFPPAVYSIFSSISSAVAARLAIAMAIILMLAQAYQLFFHSWVSQYYASTKTRDCAIAIGSIASTTTVFFYQAPELVTFYRGPNYYQYIDSIETDASRTEKRKLIEKGIPTVLTGSSDIIQSLDGLTAKYKETGSCERYEILTRK